MQVSRHGVVETTSERNDPMTVPLTGGPEVHELAAAARERSWYALTPFGFPGLLRYRDCERALRDPRFREIGLDLLHMSGIVDGPLYDWYRLIMFASDGDAHRRLRSLVSLAFTPKSMEATRGAVRDDIDRLCDGIDGEFDLVDRIAHWMPVLAVSGMLGIPDEDVRTFGDWSARLGGIFSAFITPEHRQELETALAMFTEYVVELIAQRRANPGDDLASRLIGARDDGDRLSEEELVAMILNLVIGGHDATERTIATGMWTLLQHPDQWRALCVDPSLVPGAVEEVLRYEPAASGAARVATEDVDWDGLEIPAGGMLGIMTIAANRDPEVFIDADRFDIRRTDARHLAFGGGPHYCLGASLGRIVTQETIAAIARRWPDITPVDAHPSWAPSERGFRGVLEVRLATR